MFLRRISQGPLPCAGCKSCPDIWELADGDFAIIGKDITDVAIDELPATAGCGPDERIIRLPRNLLVSAKPRIPN